MAPRRDRFASKFDELNTTFASLSPEAATVFGEARDQLDRWIEAKFAELAERAEADVAERQKDVEKLRDQLTAEQAETRKRMDEVVGRLRQATAALPSDDQQLADLSRQVVEATETVRTELEAREAKWRALGEKAVEAVAKTAETVVKLVV